MPKATDFYYDTTDVWNLVTEKLHKHPSAVFLKFNTCLEYPYQRTFIQWQENRIEYC